MKNEGHLGRSGLKGHHGSRANAVLTFVGYKFRLILRWLRVLLRLILAAIRADVEPTLALNPAS